MCSWSCVSCTMFERDWVFWPFISIQPWHCTDSVYSQSPLPSLVTPKTCSVWQVPVFFPSMWGLLAGMPGFASHGSGLLLPKYKVLWGSEPFVMPVSRIKNPCTFMIWVTEPYMYSTIKLSYTYLVSFCVICTKPHFNFTRRKIRDWKNHSIIPPRRW